MLDRLKSILEDFDSRLSRQPTYGYAVVTSVNPLRIQYDAQSAPIAGTPDTLVSGLKIGDRVWCQRIYRKDIILGRGKGDEPTTGTVTPVAGASVYADHAHKLSRTGNTCHLNVTVQGGGVGGLVTVPPLFRPASPTVIGTARGSQGTLVGDYFLLPSGLITIIYTTGTADSGGYWPIAGTWQI